MGCQGLFKEMFRQYLGLGGKGGLRTAQSRLLGEARGKAGETQGVKVTLIRRNDNCLHKLLK
jgi:hypothetical protein